MRFLRELDRKKIIDIHAHILPGVDDGARDLKESIALAVSAASQGIRAVIATPHFSRQGDPDEYRQLLKRRRSGRAARIFSCIWVRSFIIMRTWATGF